MLEFTRLAARIAEFVNRVHRVGARSAASLVAATTLLLLAQGLAPIEEVELGARVADTGLELSPSREGCDDEPRWCAITAERETADGHLQELALLRPAQWLEGGELEPGAWISTGAAGAEFESFARVTGVAAASVERGPGALVVATMSREVDECLSIRLCGQPDPLLVTAEHPLWSAAAGFVPAGSLAVGELLATRDGVAQIEAIAKVDGPLRVFNLEVDRTNSYFVGAGLVLAHNECPGNARAGETEATRAGRQAHKEFAERVEQKPGWKSEERIPGTRLRPDAIDPKGRPVELKPDTPSGRAQGEKQIEKYKQALGGVNGKIVYYPPPGAGG